MAAEKTLKFILFLGSTRDGRMGDRVTKFVKKHMEAHNLSVEVLDPLELDLPLLKQPLHFYRDQSQAPQLFHECNKKICDADAFIVVSSEYNCGIPPALSNTMSHFSPKSYSYKPSGIVTYSLGNWGGVRAAVVLRPFLAELGCIATHQSLAIPKVSSAMDEDGNPKEDHLVPGVTKFIAELQWMAAALRNHRDFVGLPN